MSFKYISTLLKFRNKKTMSTRNVEMRMTPKYFWCFNRYIELSKISKEERITLKKILNFYHSVPPTKQASVCSDYKENRSNRDVKEYRHSFDRELRSMLFTVHHLFNAPLEVMEGYTPNNHLV